MTTSNKAKLSLWQILVLALGKTVRAAILLVRPGGGTSIPGRVIEKLSPKLLAKLLSQTPGGIIAVTGSNGKSTTTKMLVRVLEDHGLKVLTNKFTANTSWGIIAELLAVVNWRGTTGDDIAVIEMDEGYSALIAEQVPLRMTVFLNIMIDQLHRWYEPERVAGYLLRTAKNTSERLVVNRHDGQLVKIVSDLKIPKERLSFFAVIDEIVAKTSQGLGSAGEFSGITEFPASSELVQVTKLQGKQTEITLNSGEKVAVTLPARGLHFAVDSAAAIQTAQHILAEKFDSAIAAKALSNLPTVFGRGEVVKLQDQAVEFILAKSPPSTQANLDFLDPETEKYFLAIGIDVVDPSQLWGNDWSALRKVEKVSGAKAWDAALRLAYDEVEIVKVDPDLLPAIDEFLAAEAPSRGVKTVIFSAQAMRAIRRHLDLTYADTEVFDG